MKFFLFGLVLFGAFGVSSASPVQLTSTLNCTICELLVDVFHDVLFNSTVDETIEKTIEFMCVALNISDSIACNGYITDFYTEVVYVIKKLVEEDPKNFCGFLFPTSCGYTFNPFETRWPMKLPGIKPEHKDTPGPRENKTLKVLHLSDIHIDTQYLPGSEAICVEPQCCRAPNNSHEFITTNSKNLTASYWGTIAPCDLPYWTAEAMLQHISTNHQDIDYVVVSGDLESHAEWTYNTKDHAYMIKNVSGLLKKYFPNTNVYFALGNHEGVPIDNIAPHWVPKSNLSYQLYDTIFEAWSQWVPSDQETVVKYRGCYVVKLYPGLRLISLNNVYGDPFNL